MLRGCVGVLRAVVACVSVGLRDVDCARRGHRFVKDREKGLVQDLEKGHHGRGVCCLRLRVCQRQKTDVSGVGEALRL